MPFTGEFHQILFRVLPNMPFCPRVLAVMLFIWEIWSTCPLNLRVIQDMPFTRVLPVLYPLYLHVFYQTCPLAKSSIHHALYLKSSTRHALNLRVLPDMHFTWEFYPTCPHSRQRPSTIAMTHNSHPKQLSDVKTRKIWVMLRLWQRRKERSDGRTKKGKRSV